jgi:general secretion pathway protein N
VKRWQLVALGLAAYAFALIAAAPATLIDARLQQTSAGALRLAEASGTLWSGSGQIEIRDASRRKGIARRVAWRARPAYLLRAKLRYDVSLDDAGKPFPVSISLARVEVTDAAIDLPAAALGLGVPRLVALGLTGDVLLRIGRLAFERDSIRGNATLQWRRAGSTFTPVSPLGDYELRIDADGSAVRASLRTLRGPLQLDGKGSWTGGSKPVVLATARIAPQYREQLAPLLRLIAVEGRDGSFTLR